MLGPGLLWIFIVLMLAASTVAAPRDKSGNPQLISGFGMVLIMFMAFILIPSANTIFVQGGKFYWTDQVRSQWQFVLPMILTAFSFFVFVLAYCATGRNRQGDLQPEAMTFDTSPDQKDSITGVFLIAVGMIVGGLFLKLLMIQIGGGLETTILKLSPGVAKNLGIERGNALLFRISSISNIADVGATALLIYALSERKYRAIATVAFFLVVAVSVLITGKRMAVLWPMLAALLAFSRFVAPIKPRHLVIGLPLIFGFGFLTLMYRIFAPMAALGETIHIASVPWSNGTLWGFYMNSLEFSYFELLLTAIEARDQITAQFGGTLGLIYTTHIEPFAMIVPRVLWPGKPDALYDISHAFTALLRYETLETSGYGTAASLVGTAWVSGGVIGTIVLFGVLGVFCAFIDSGYFRNVMGSNPIIQIFLYSYCILVVFQAFRQGTFGWVFILTFVQQLGMIFGVIVLFVLLNQTKRRLRR